MAEEVCDEKQNSNWFSQKSKFLHQTNFYVCFSDMLPKIKENHHILSRNLFTFKFEGQTRENQLFHVSY